ncbi:peptide chain release factor 1 [candidate division TA06 bacterium]|uniref:Peptide chain release factor 1 n=1 Tax=candidate division TA06 bacterium TaxID=2250710 RepID=A0A660S5T2_UNCT6|nr:MAG: peptide chain release factor 1 [candidate division TA06 bacterium]
MLNENLIEKLNQLEEKHKKLQQDLSDPAVMKDMNRFRSLSQEEKELSDTLVVYRNYNEALKQLRENEELMGVEKDPDMLEMIKEEITKLKEQIESYENRLIIALLPKDPRDSRNAIMEIRAGVGGEEASLFAGDLFRMYSKYAEGKGWKIGLIDSHPTELGGFKEIIFSVEGNGVYGKLKYESGAHRVQRVPTTESGGRIHTSAVTVAVLPEAEDVDIDINPSDVKMDVFHSSGAGGQNVNKVATAIRLTHIPTGIVVVCQDERSQYKNRVKAMKVLKARLYDMKVKEENAKIENERRKQVGSGDRSERIRTYNFPQNRVTDHRVNLTLYKLGEIMEGHLDELIDTLIVQIRTKMLDSI